jgi:hypothetical protein
MAIVATGESFDRQIDAASGASFPGINIKTFPLGDHVRRMSTGGISLTSGQAGG